MASNTYSRSEKLKSRKALNAVFTAGRTFTVFPVKVFYTLGEKAEQSVKAGVGVSTRHFKKAVDRNRIKRLLRECYRVQKTGLNDVLLRRERSVSVFFLYVGKELPEYELLYSKMTILLTKLEEQLG